MSKYLLLLIFIYFFSIGTKVYANEPCTCYDMNRKYTCGAVQNNKICCQSQWVNCTNKDSCMCENDKNSKIVSSNGCCCYYMNFKYSCGSKQYNQCCCQSRWVTCVGHDCFCCGYTKSLNSTNEF